MRPACLAALLAAAAAPPPPDADFAALQAALLAAQLPARGDALAAATQRRLDAAVPALIATLTPAGLWPDVVYNDTADRSEWRAGEHLRRCLILGVSAAAENAASALAGDAAARNATLACTRGWLVLDPQNSNCNSRARARLLHPRRPLRPILRPKLTLNPNPTMRALHDP